jgi:hypothetical protein
VGIRFIGWEEIKEINIIERESEGALHKIAYILLLSNTEYKFFISNWKGFEKAIRSLGKEHLLKKDFKYSKIIDLNISDKEREKRFEELNKKEEILEE